MVGTKVIGCGYNYPFVRLVIHHGSFRSFVVLHQKSNRLACDSWLGINPMNYNTKSKAKIMHIYSSFVEPNAWIMDTENYQWHNLHLVVDGQSQQCSLIPVAQSCDNCLWQAQVVSLQPPLPLPMLRVRATMVTSFMNEDLTSLMNFCWFVTLDEPNCFLCCVCGSDGDVCHLNQNCPLLLDGYQCFKCLGPHPRADCHNSIPHSPNNCPKCHLLHNMQVSGNVPLHEGRYGVDCPS
jgi:hypothetical protein